MNKNYDPDDILMWASPEEIKKLKDAKQYKGTRF